MSKQTSYLLGIIGTIILGSLLYSKFCCNCCSTDNFKVVPLITNENKGIANLFSFSKDNFKYSCDSNFNYSLNDFNYKNPLDKCIDEGIVALKNFFDKNPNAKLKITGYCTDRETNSSAFPNLGFARANNIKNYFISKGLASNRFDINGEKSQNLRNLNNVLQGPAVFTLSNDIITAKGEDFEVLKEKIIADPLTLYFNTNQTEINLTEAERQKVLNLSHYIDNVPSAQINCVGHTDNIGDRNVNIHLGQERANFIKEYLIKNGIPEDKITTSSKGPDEPITSNLTPEGKAKNRRTIVTLK